MSMSDDMDFRGVVRDLQEDTRDLKRSVEDLSKSFSRHLEKEEERHELLVRVSERVESFAARVGPCEEKITKVDKRLSKTEVTAGNNKWFVRVLAALTILAALAGNINNFISCNPNSPAEASQRQEETSHGSHKSRPN